jgi:GNAT superfamily N-acetyltransferase
MIRVGHSGAEVGSGSIILTDAPSVADFRVIFRALDDFNASVIGHAQLQPVAVLLHDESGMVVGGLWGRTNYGWLAIEMLFVPGPLRGRGIGSALVSKAEAAARVRDCIGVQVDTFDFQARSFYERLGFTVFGVQDDLPPGHRCFYLCKRVDERRDRAPELGTAASCG